ncbi:MAG: VWA domain-containing protein [candidate division WS1 bacterium]|jgi:Ca-activated chloride channel family protein|nr:VWA domain-containing protein [candidate division WS1 bacterium]
MTDFFQWGNPSALVYLWLLPVLLILHLWAMRQRRRALQLIFPELTAERTAMASVLRRRNFKFLLLMVATTMLIVALAQPLIGARRERARREGVEIVIVLDTSLSMAARDVKPSRMSAAKQAITEIIGRLGSDRVGLVLFAGNAFRYCPLTSDHDAALMFLEAVDMDSTPQPGTAIGQALTIGEQMLGEAAGKYRALVLVSDGEDHSTGALERANEINRETGATIMVLGVGTAEGDAIPLVAPDGTVTDFKRDRDGEVVITKLYEDELKQIARAGNGVYRRLTESGAVALISGRIDSLEGVQVGTYVYADYAERFHWPLLLAILLLIAESLIAEQRPISKRWGLPDA